MRFIENLASFLILNFYQNPILSIIPRKVCGVFLKIVPLFESLSLVSPTHLFKAFMERTNFKRLTNLTIYHKMPQILKLEL